MKYTALLLFFLFSSTILAAQDTVLNQKVEQLLELSGAKAQFGTVLDGMLATYQENPAMMQGVPAGFWDKFAEEAKTNAFDDLLDRMVGLYLKYYTEEELDHQIAYLQSPLTQRIVAKQPQLMQESMSVGGDWGKALGEEIVRQLNEAKEKKH